MAEKPSPLTCQPANWEAKVDSAGWSVCTNTDGRIRSPYWMGETFAFPYPPRHISVTISPARYPPSDLRPASTSVAPDDVCSKVMPYLSASSQSFLTSFKAEAFRLMFG